MALKGKTRVVAQVDWRKRELFSVEERASGDLTIITRHEALHERNGNRDDLVWIIADRFSVHRSPMSTLDATTITHTRKTSDGRTLSSAALIKDSRSSLLWPAYAIRTADLRNARYDFDTSERDRTIVLTEYHPELATLAFVVWICNIDRSFADWSECQSKATEVCFTHFKIVIFHTFFHAPTLDISDRALISTAPRRADGIPMTAGLPEPGQSYSSDQVPAVLMELYKGMVDRFVDRISTTLDPNDPRFAAVKRMINWMSATPPMTVDQLFS